MDTTLSFGERTFSGIDLGVARVGLLLDAVVLGLTLALGLRLTLIGRHLGSHPWLLKIQLPLAGVEGAIEPTGSLTASYTLTRRWLLLAGTPTWHLAAAAGLSALLLLILLPIDLRLLRKRVFGDA